VVNRIWLTVVARQILAIAYVAFEQARPKLCLTKSSAHEDNHRCHNTPIWYRKHLLCNHAATLPSPLSNLDLTTLIPLSAKSRSHSTQLYPVRVIDSIPIPLLVVRNTKICRFTLPGKARCAHGAPESSTSVLVVQVCSSPLMFSALHLILLSLL
jgi:hypothetical protein